MIICYHNNNNLGSKEVIVPKKTTTNIIGNINDIEFNVGYDITLTSTMLKLSVLKELKKVDSADITLEQYEILFVISQNQGSYQRQLSKMLFKDRPNMTRMLNILENKGFITREREKRISKVYITESGISQVRKVAPCKNIVLEKAIETLNFKQMKALKNILDVMRNNLDKEYKIKIF